MNAAFVITAYSTKDNRCVIDCVQSLRKYHKNIKIIVVDSKSPDKTYFDIIKEFNVEICDINNMHRETGAIWYVFENYENIDYYYFLQDSLICLENADHLVKKEFSCLRYFPSWDGKKFKGTPGNLYTRCGWADADVPIEKNGLGFKYLSENGLDDRNWLSYQLKKNSPEVKIPLEWNSIFGPVFFCTREILQKIHDTGFNKILPSNKFESCIMERAWGIIFEYFGINVYNNAVQKYYLHPDYNEDYLFKKNFYLR